MESCFGIIVIIPFPLGSGIRHASIIHASPGTHPRDTGTQIRTRVRDGARISGVGGGRREMEREALGDATRERANGRYIDICLIHVYIYMYVDRSIERERERERESAGGRERNRGERERERERGRDGSVVPRSASSLRSVSAGKDTTPPPSHTV